MSREVTIHRRRNDADTAIKITASEPHNGASNTFEFESEARNLGILRFQDGPVPEVGVNGLTNEAVLAAVLTRLHQFNAGKHACMENRRAINHLEIALEYLHARTAEREHRGVEGTDNV